MQSELFDQRGCFKRRHDAAAIVMRALTYVPRIQVPTHDHDFIRLLTPHNLTHHISRVCIGLEVSFHLQMHAHALAGLNQPMDPDRRLPRRRRPPGILGSDSV